MGQDAEAELSFAGLLRQLRGEARLTQEELAEGAGLSPRSVSDLERGINRTARKDSARMLAGALGLNGDVRAAFIAAARGRAPVAEVLAAQRAAAVPTAAATRSLPRDIGGFTGREPELARLAGTLASAADGGLVSHAGPSWRMIVDWTGRDSATGEGVYPGGQSENPASPWYSDQMADWWNGRYLTMPPAGGYSAGPVLWTLSPGSDGG